MELSKTIKLTEAAIDQAIQGGEPFKPEAVAALQEAMLDWAGRAQALEHEIATRREREGLPEALANPRVRFDNVVPIGSPQ